ncbi:hypothetical protein KP509_1Z016500 [Ceratopteris richardii]|nr:hypothetical protein KP509_1Z016500 [Ceratopteris richardii]
MPSNLDVGGSCRRAEDPNGSIPIDVKMDKVNDQSLQKRNSTDGTELGDDGKDRGKNAKQLTWIMLLKTLRVISGVSWLVQAVYRLAPSIRKRIAFNPRMEERTQRLGEKPRTEKLFIVIKALVLFACATLGLEVMAYVRGWQFTASRLYIPGTQGIQELMQIIYLSWITFRANWIAPLLQSFSNICLALFLIQSVDRIIQCLGCTWIRLRRIKPRPAVQSLDKGDLEEPFSSYPMVLIQIPMCNEKEVYHQSIAAAAKIDWPRDRMLVQILDDSDDTETQTLIRNEVQKWHQKGINIKYRHRALRTGYKAGNLKSAMNCDYVQDYEFVAIFDADFQPPSDFLKRTIIHFQGNDELGLVQTRWSFVNKDESLLTRLQYINLSYHFEVEQQVNGVFLGFFGFNGTAGVWRIKALEESGGWLERTTVEDMDIAVRAHLNGWKFIFLNDVKCHCELPESFEAYRKQQHRWHSGPMQLFRLCFVDILKSKISLWKKTNLIFLFFLLRKLVIPFYSFSLFCIILPLTMFVPEVRLPTWAVCYLPAITSLMNIAPTPKSLPFIVPHLLFENTMSITKFNAMISGLFQLGDAYEWIVTKKVGRASENDLVALAEMEARTDLELSRLRRGSSASDLDSLRGSQIQPIMPRRRKTTNRLYRKELTLAFLLLLAAAQSLLSLQGVHFYFLALQGISFLLVGLDLIGEQAI